MSMNVILLDLKTIEWFEDDRYIIANKYGSHATVELSSLKAHRNHYLGSQSFVMVF